jgi:hypothetical protein
MSAHTGGCACRAVRYRVEGDLRPVVACHCETCRRITGHHVAATACGRDRLTLESAGTLTWWASSPGIRRGFCGRCGGNLFWEREGDQTVSIGAGTLDLPTGLTLVGHIFTAEKGDYYELEDGLPQAALRPGDSPGSQP